MTSFRWQLPAAVLLDDLGFIIVSVIFDDAGILPLHHIIHRLTHTSFISCEIDSCVSPT